MASPEITSRRMTADKKRALRRALHPGCHTRTHGRIRDELLRSDERTRDDSPCRRRARRPCHGLRAARGGNEGRPGAIASAPAPPHARRSLYGVESGLVGLRGAMPAYRPPPGVPRRRCGCRPSRRRPSPRPAPCRTPTASPSPPCEDTDAYRPTACDCLPGACMKAAHGAFSANTERAVKADLGVYTAWCAAQGRSRDLHGYGVLRRAARRFRPAPTRSPPSWTRWRSRARRPRFAATSRAWRWRTGRSAAHRRRRARR